MKRLVSSRETFSALDDLWINSSLERRRPIRRKVTSGVDAIWNLFGRENVESKGEEGLR